MGANLGLEKAPSSLLPHFDEIIALANSERKSLGFLREQAMREGIERGKMLALLDPSGEKTRLAAYLLYSGVYPHAKIQQIATAEAYRHQGVASALLRALIAELEQLGFMSIQADVASDLDTALAFYTKNGFERVKVRPGGASRNRQIVMHTRELDTETLFARAGDLANAIDLGIRRRSAGGRSFFALDLNVYFDLVKDRSHSEAARRLFGAALAHELRLAVADEFVDELRRTSQQGKDDPILQLALRLPRMPKAAPAEWKHLRDQMHGLIFAEGGVHEAASAQSLSDAGHLAHAALARASAFVTRDGAILDSRAELLQRFGIDVLSLEELVITLPATIEHSSPDLQKGPGFVCRETSPQIIRDFLKGQCLEEKIIRDFSEDESHLVDADRLAIWKQDEIAACAVLLQPRVPSPVNRLLVWGRPESLEVELYIDYLLDKMLRKTGKSLATAVELERVAGQSTLTKVARARGFTRQASSPTLVKVVMGRPVTASSWAVAARELRLRAGLELPLQMPAGSSAGSLSFKTNICEEISVSLMALENMLEPTLLIQPDQDGVIVPITRSYSKLLLDAGPQMSLGIVDDRSAAFLSKKAYVNSPRSFNVMRSERPILFYESMRSGGVGGVVAVARIVDAMISGKRDIPHDSLKRLVVEDVAEFSSGEEALVTSFENLFVLPRSVPFARLKAIGAVDESNLVTAKPVSGGMVAEILEEGWSNGRR